MEIEEIKQIETVEELPDSWWHRVYLAVIITTIIVISVLGAFTRYFSS
jgi:hypothetical protein